MKANDVQPQVGVYICYCGGNISDHVDVEDVRSQVEDLSQVSVARTNMFMCSDPGQEMIIDDIRSGRVNRVVVASCAPDLHELTFKSALIRGGMNTSLYEHVNIREQVSWVHHGPEATEKAVRLVAAGVAKAGRLKELYPIRVSTTRHVTVVGGGVAGLTATCELARNGLEVTLIEGSSFLGGHVAGLNALAPDNVAPKRVLTLLTDFILSSERVTVHTCSRLTGFSGSIGQFDVHIKRSSLTGDELQARRETAELSPGQYVPGHGVFFPGPDGDGKEQTVRTGAILLCTGFTAYEPLDGEYGYKSSHRVMTLPQFEAALQEDTAGNGSGFLQIRGQKIRNMVMIHCVGSRQIPGIDTESEDRPLNEYCSRTCCTALISAANRIRNRFPQTQVYNVYRDIRTYGRGHEELYATAAENRVRFVRYEPEEKPQVVKDPDSGGLVVSVKDTLTFGHQVDIPADLVVLGGGMQSGPVSELAGLLKVPLGSDGFVQEIHPKLRPVETAVHGVLVAGTCQAPMDTVETRNSAACAAAKACSLLGQGEIEMDPFVAEVDHSLCQGHGQCIQVCLKEGALHLQDGQAVVDKALCLGCGACVAACPQGAIQLANNTLEQYEAMVEAIVAA